MRAVGAVRAVMTVGAVLFTASTVSTASTAQIVRDTVLPTPTPSVGDSGSHRPSPLGSFWRSLVLPGWGQAVNDRHMVGALFVAFEGVSAMMTIKASREADYYREINSPQLDSKKQEKEDWLVLWVFNHLLSGAEAFVSAHLRDFPPDLKLRALPGGVAVTVPMPRW